MQTQQVVLDKAEAHKLFRKYREHRAYSTPMDREIERIAKLVSEGKLVVQALASIVTAGLNADRLPKLALVRADARSCHLRTLYNGGAHMSATERWHSRARIGTVFDFPSDTFPGIARGHFKAATPLVPPDIRPKRGLANYHILFEAEWREVVPVDPMLLRRIGRSDLWIVVGAWELTPIERAVIAGHSGLAM